MDRLNSIPERDSAILSAFYRWQTEVGGLQPLSSATEVSIPERDSGTSVHFNATFTPTRVYYIWTCSEWYKNIDKKNNCLSTLKICSAMLASITWMTLGSKYRDRNSSIPVQMHLFDATWTFLDKNVTPTIK